MYEEDANIDPQPLIDLIPRRVDDHMNEALTKPFSENEISDALFQIGPMKAPGPDGFPARFFQKNWAVLKEE